MSRNQSFYLLLILNGLAAILYTALSGRRILGVPVEAWLIQVLISELFFVLEGQKDGREHP